MPESNDINPRIFDQEIGIEDLRKIKIYPLSAGHQLEMTEIISKAVAAFVSMKPKEDDPESMVKFVSFILGLIKENISRIIEYITKNETEDVLNEVAPRYYQYPTP